MRQTPSPTPPPIADARSPASFIEVGVFATRDFKKGEIVNLRGGVADLSEEEDDKMREGGGRSDFSVLWSERKKCFGLLLGPARFVNVSSRTGASIRRLELTSFAYSTTAATTSNFISRAPT